MIICKIVVEMNNKRHTCDDHEINARILVACADAQLCTRNFIHREKEKKEREQFNRKGLSQPVQHMA